MRIERRDLCEDGGFCTPGAPLAWVPRQVDEWVTLEFIQQFDPKGRPGGVVVRASCVLVVHCPEECPKDKDKEDVKFNYNNNMLISYTLYRRKCKKRPTCKSSRDANRGELIGVISPRAYEERFSESYLSNPNNQAEFNKLVKKWDELGPNEREVFGDGAVFNGMHSCSEPGE